MAESGSFGYALRAARTQLGMSLDEAGRRLRIDPIVLESIENEDFANMPPKYTASSMVNAYAQMMGLNPSVLTRDYLDAEFKYQKALSTGASYGGVTTQYETRTRQGAAQGYGVDALAASRPARDGLPQTTGSVNFRTTDATKAAAAAAEVAAPKPTMGMGRTTGNRTSFASNLSSDSGRQRFTFSENGGEATAGATSSGRPKRYNPDGTVRRSRFTAGRDLDDIEEEESYEAPATPAAGGLAGIAQRVDLTRIIMIVGCVLAVVLIFVLIKVIFVRDTNDNPNGTGGQVISGITDPEAAGVQSTTGGNVLPTAIKPTVCYFSLQVANDSDGAYVEIYTYDGERDWSDENLAEWNLGNPSNGWTNEVRSVLEGGMRKQFDVTKYLYIYTNNPNDISLTVNGERVDWVWTNSRWCYTVDFPAYLDQWEKDHPDTN